MHKFKELKVWQKSVDFAVEIYSLTKKFPSDERFGLTSQATRSAVSIPSNIAEGAGRNTKGEFNHFLGIATGSSFELETQLIIANKLGFVDNEGMAKACSELSGIQNMLIGLQNSLNTNN